MFHTRSAKPATRISSERERRRTRPHVSQRPALQAGNKALVRCFQDGRHPATERDSQHLLRAIELAGRARGQTSPNPIVGAVVVKDGRVIGEGITQPPGEGHAEVMALEAAAGPHRGGDDVRLARAVLPPRPHAAVHGRDRLRRHRARGDRLRRSDPQGRRPRPGDPPRRGREGGLRGRRHRRGRAHAEPALPQARPNRPAARGLQVRDDARRQGGHPHRRLPVDLAARRAARARTAGAPSRTPWRSASAPR